MVRVQRANVLLDVDDDALNKFLHMGYNQVDPITGEILNESVPTDIGSLQVAYNRHKAEIAELKAKVAELESEKAKATKTATKAKKNSD